MCGCGFLTIVKIMNIFRYACLWHGFVELHVYALIINHFYLLLVYNQKERYKSFLVQKENLLRAISKTIPCIQSWFIEVSIR